MERIRLPSLRREATTCLWIIALGLAIYLLTLPADLRNNADTSDRFNVTQSIIQNHTLEDDCSNPHDARFVRGRHGCWYTIYAPGQTLLMIPLYGVAKAVSATTGLDRDFANAVSVRSLDCILGALLLALFYLLCLVIGYRRRTALLLTLLLAFASTLWPDVQSGQEQTQVSLAVVLAVLAALRALVQGGRSRDLWLVVCGLALGFGLLTRYDFIIYAVVIFGFLMWMLMREAQGQDTGSSRLLRDPLIVIASALPFVLFDGAWNTLRFGAPWRVGQSPSAQFGFPLWQGVPNLLLSPGKGIIWYLPLLWLLPFASSRFRRRSPEVFWLAAAISLAAVVFYGNVMYWHGDPAWGPRYLFPVVPLLMLPLGVLIEQFGTWRPTLRAVFVAVATLSLALQIAAVTVDPWRFWYHLIQVRGQAGQVFQWKPTQYNYYWPGNVSLIPELYQFRGVTDIVSIGLGDQSVAMPFPAPSESAQSAKGCALTSVRSYDSCQLWGVAKRPLNSIDSIWLNDRYQWADPLPVPLSLLARVLIVAVLCVMAIVSSMRLYIEVWRQV